MELSDFAIGETFWTHAGAFRCTDIGTRVVVAVKLGPREISKGRKRGWRASDHEADRRRPELVERTAVRHRGSWCSTRTSCWVASVPRPNCWVMARTIDGVACSRRLHATPAIGARWL